MLSFFTQTIGDRVKTLGVSLGHLKGNQGHNYFFFNFDEINSNGDALYSFFD